MFEALTQGLDTKKMDTMAAQSARPFVSPVVWASHSAYSAVYGHVAIRMLGLRQGVGDVGDIEAINKLVVAALPHYEKYMNEHGASAYHYVLDALETKLLSDIQAMLKGSEGDKDAVARAAEIVKLSEAVIRGDSASVV
jgi:hypothetical protein